MSRRLDLCVVGGGAIGGLLAAKAARAGLKVAVWERRPELRRILAERGLRVASSTETFTARVQVPDRPEEIQAADWVALCVKAQDTAQAARQVAGLVARSEACVLSLQNGLGNLEAIEQAVGPGRTLLGVLALGAHVPRPGLVVQAGDGPIRLGAPPGGPEHRLQEAAALLRRADFQVEVVSDILAAVWRKLAVNLVVNPLTALLGVRNGALLELESLLRPLLERILDEILATAEAEGVQLDRDETWAEIRSVIQTTAENRSSMLQDVTAGRPTESPGLGLALAERARRAGLAAPVSESLALLVEAKAQARALGLTET